MPHKASVTEVWDPKRGRSARLAYRRLLISVPSILLSIGIGRSLYASTIISWTAWFASAALAIFACVFAAEVVFGVRGTGKSDETSFTLSLARAVMWLTIFWIVYLAMVVFFEIAVPNGVSAIPGAGYGKHG